jgi:uncharacterized membrane protein YoaK (UPF0700 family)
MRIGGITVTSIILSFVAGYADTSTFFGADGLFSAHITGNFVVFAYDIASNQISSSWIKLMSFPVFILAVIFSTLIFGDANIYKRAANKLLIMEGCLLLIAGGMTYFYKYENIAFILKVIVPMLVVFALGMQNAYGRLSAKEVLAPTTVMTGNVTQWFIDMTNYFTRSEQRQQEFIARIFNGMYVIFPFLIGCISGGLVTKSMGLSSTVFIGILVLIASRNRTDPGHIQVQEYNKKAGQNPARL